MHTKLLGLALLLSLTAATPVGAQVKVAKDAPGEWTALGAGPCGVVGGQAYCLDPLGAFPVRRAVGQSVVSAYGGDNVVCGVTPARAGVCGDAVSTGRGRHAIDDVRFIAGAYYRGTWCAALSSGGVRCGTIESGSADATPPTAPAGLPDTVQFAEAIGGLASCARTERGQIWCWGHNRAGELGRGETSDSTAAPIAGGERYRALTTGERAWCGLTVDGVMRCWGDGRVSVFGTQALDQCTTGRGDPFPCALTPRPIALPGPARLIAVSAAGSCAVLEDRRLVCWGSRFHASVTPVTGVPADIVELGVGGSTGCARTAAGEVWCWSLTGRERVAQRLQPPRADER